MGVLYGKLAYLAKAVRSVYSRQSRSLSWVVYFATLINHLIRSTPTRCGPRLKPAGFTATRFDSWRELQTATTLKQMLEGRPICALARNRTWIVGTANRNSIH